MPRLSRRELLRQATLAGAALPLHNHEGMTVATRLLYGQLEHTSYDWEPPGNHTAGGRAVVRHDRLLRAGPATFLLRPELGNVHELRAVTPCAILDVLAPPYDGRSRPCRYFEVVSSSQGIAMLRPVPEPASFRVTSAGSAPAAADWTQ